MVIGCCESEGAWTRRARAFLEVATAPPSRIIVAFKSVANADY